MDRRHWQATVYRVTNSGTTTEQVVTLSLSERVRDK